MLWALVLFYTSTVCSPLGLSSRLLLFSGISSVLVLDLRWAGLYLFFCNSQSVLQFTSQRSTFACLGPGVPFLASHSSYAFLPSLESIVIRAFSLLPLCQVLVSSVAGHCSSLFFLCALGSSCWLPLQLVCFMSLVRLLPSSWLVFPFSWVTLHLHLWCFDSLWLFPSWGLASSLTVSPVIGFLPGFSCTLLPRSNLRFSQLQGPPFGPSQLPVSAICAFLWFACPSPPVWVSLSSTNFCLFSFLLVSSRAPLFRWVFWLLAALALPFSSIGVTSGVWSQCLLHPPGLLSLTVFRLGAPSGHFLGPSACFLWCLPCFPLLVTDAHPSCLYLRSLPWGVGLSLSLISPPWSSLLHWWFATMLVSLSAFFLSGYLACFLLCLHSFAAFLGFGLALFLFTSLLPRSNLGSSAMGSSLWAESVQSVVSFASFSSVLVVFCLHVHVPLSILVVSLPLPFWLIVTWGARFCSACLGLPLPLSSLVELRLQVVGCLPFFSFFILPCLPSGYFMRSLLPAGAVVLSY